MGTSTEISWTDKTWNFAHGCFKISPGCKNCYAIRSVERLARQMQHTAKADYYKGIAENGNWTGTVKIHEENLRAPLAWNAPSRIFVASLSDPFHEAISDETLDRAFAIMALTPQHTYQLLTKRPERALQWFTAKRPITDTKTDVAFWAVQASRTAKLYDGRGIVWDGRGPDWWRYTRESEYDVRNRRPFGWPLPNVWIGVSVENQATADQRIPILLQIPAGKRFLSCEPLLGPVDLVYPTFNGADSLVSLEGLHWVIVGGESGPGYRPMNPSWARSIRDQCVRGGVSFFYKQDAAPRPGTRPELDGVTWYQFPADAPRLAPTGPPLRGLEAPTPPPSLQIKSKAESSSQAFAMFNQAELNYAPKK